MPLIQLLFLEQRTLAATRRFRRQVRAVRTIEGWWPVVARSYHGRRRTAALTVQAFFRRIRRRRRAAILAASSLIVRGALIRNARARFIQRTVSTFFAAVRTIQRAYRAFAACRTARQALFGMQYRAAEDAALVRAPQAKGLG